MSFHHEFAPGVGNDKRSGWETPIVTSKAQLSRKFKSQYKLGVKRLVVDGRPNDASMMYTEKTKRFSLHYLNNNADDA